MKKKITALFTAAALTACMAGNFPAYAETVTLSCAPLIQNMINIEVKDKNGDLVEGADLKIMDENGVCAAKFTGNTDNGIIMNQSGLKVVPYDDTEVLVTPTIDFAKSCIPDEDKIIQMSYSGNLNLADGEKNIVEIYHYNDDDVSTDYILEEGNVAFYTHPAFNLKAATGSITLNGTEYSFKSSLDYSNYIAEYPVDEITQSSMYYVNSQWGGSGRSISGLYPQEGTGEYIKVRKHLSELSARFTADGKYILPAEENGSGSDITFDLVNDNRYAYSCFSIISGSMVSTVVPDSSGYVEFYVDRKTRLYMYYIMCNFAYDSGNSITTSSSRSDSMAFIFADCTEAELTAPDFPEAGTSFMNVPAGKYTIEADSIPEGYVLSEPVEINVQESEDIQNFTVVLEDYVEPTEPADGITVYPKDNIVNIIVKDYNGNLVTDAEMTLKGTNQRAAFNSGGTSFEKTSYTDFEWYENGLTEKSMWIPYERFVEAAKVENAFGMCFADENYPRAYTGSFSMNSGETRAFNIFSKDDSVQADAVLEKGVMGLYVDPKWETNSAYTGYLIINGEPVYINPADSSIGYGAVQYIDVGTYTDSMYAGLCEPGTVPEKGWTALRPDITEENSEYIKVRCHIKEFSDEFADNGTIAPDDYLIDPRNNKENANCIILITSGGMVNAVIPDENGYVEFYADKSDRFAQLDCFGSYYGAGFTSSFSRNGSYVAAECFAGNFTAAELPDTGVVLTEVPAGEYTLSFSSVNEDYRNPGAVSITVEEKTGIQTVEIILQQNFSLGDVDDNGKIEINDASLTLMEYAISAAGLDSELTESQKLAADVNEDGLINIADATLILGYYAYKAAGGTGSIIDYLSA